MSDRIKYKYAFDSSAGQLIDVEELEKKDRKRVFTCLGCDNIVIPVMGKIQQKHFRHKVDINSSCSRETYLHLFAKTKLYEIYNKCLADNSGFYIEYDVRKTCTHYAIDYLTTCEVPNPKNKLDLTQRFEKIYLEKKEGSFIPDLLLTSEKHEEKLFIEIAVTHASTAEKIESGNKIIEIFVNSESEICSLQHRPLSESRNVLFYNFKERTFIDDFCKTERHCSLSPYLVIPVPYIFFIIYNSHESALEKKTLDELDNQIEDIQYQKFMGYSLNRFEHLPIDTRNKIYFKMVREHFEMVRENFKKRYKIDNCCLCENHKPIDPTSQTEHIYCNFFSQKFNSNQAASCDHYQSNPIKISSLVKYIGGMIKYKGKIGRVINISGGFCKCEFDKKLTESFSINEIQLF